MVKQSVEIPGRAVELVSISAAISHLVELRDKINAALAILEAIK